LSKISWFPVQTNTTQHNTTQHNTTQHNTTQHNTTQHNKINNTTHHAPNPYLPLLSLACLGKSSPCPIESLPATDRQTGRQTDTIAVVVVWLCAHRSRSPAWPSENICALSSAASFLSCPAHTHTHMANGRTRTRPRPRARAHTDASRQSTELVRMTPLCVVRTWFTSYHPYCLARSTTKRLSAAR
jgi:hypothetical protein